MGRKISIYVSEPTEAILNELQGDSTSSKVAAALAQCDPNVAMKATISAMRIQALRNQINTSNKLLKRALGQVKPMLQTEIMELLVHEGL